MGKGGLKTPRAEFLAIVKAVAVNAGAELGSLLRRNGLSMSGEITLKS